MELLINLILHDDMTPVFFVCFGDLFLGDTNSGFRFLYLIKSWFLITDMKYAKLSTLRNLSSTELRYSVCSKWFLGISSSKFRVIQGCFRAWSIVYLIEGLGWHSFSMRLCWMEVNLRPNLSLWNLMVFCLYCYFSSPLTQRGCFPAMSSYMINPTAHMSTALP